MGDAFKGLTIRIGADVRPLNSALNKVKSAANSTQKEMRRLNKALNLDPSDAAVLASRFSLMQDRLRLAARETNLMKTSLKQVSAEARKTANGASDMFTNAHRTREELVRVNGRLQTMYDSMAKFKSTSEGITFDEARKHINNLVKDLSKSKSKAREAKAEFRALFQGMSTGKTNLLPFDLKSAQTAMAALNKLRASSKELDAELKRLDQVQGIRTLEMNIAAAKVEMRDAAMQAARFRSEMHAAGHGGTAINELTSQLRTLDGAIDTARSKSQTMDEAYRALPHSMEAAISKMRAMQSYESSLNQKAAVLRERMEAIEHTKGFDRQAASAKNVYAEVNKVEREYAELEMQLKETSEKAEHLREKMARLNDESGGAYRRSSKYKQDEKELQRLIKEMDRLQSEIRQTDSALEKANMEKEFVKMYDELIKVNAELKKIKGTSSIGSLIGGMGVSLKNLGYAAYSTITPGIMRAGRYIVELTEEVDAAYRNMRKTVQGTEEEFERLKDAALEYGRTHVTSADQILEIEAIGGQLGITVDNLEAFATTVSNLDIATNMETEEIAADLGKMATVLGMSNDEYDHFADSLVRLGNSEPAFESDIMKITTRFMGMGKVVGMQPQQMLAWATAATATGQKAEAAGSSMLRFVSNMESATNANEETLSAWAKVANMSANEFKESFGKDASGTMYKFIEGLAEIHKSGGSVNQTLIELGINNVRDKQLLEGLAQQMANATDENNVLRDSLQMSEDAWLGISDRWGDAGDAMREAQKKSEGFSGQLQIMKNNAQALAVELGESIAPVMSMLNDVIQHVTEALSGMPQGFKTAIVASGALAASFGPFSIALGSMMTSLTNIHGMLKRFPASWLKLSLALKGLNVAGVEDIQTLRGLKAAAEGAANTAGKSAGVFSKLAKAVTSTGIGMGGLSIAAVGFVAVGIALVACISKIVDEYNRYKKHVEDMKKATDGMRDAMRLGKMSADEMAKALEEDGEAARVSRDEFDELIAKQAELADQMKDAWKTYYMDTKKADELAEKIKELSGNTGDSAQKRAELNEAVREYNALVGTSIEVTEGDNGSLEVNTKELDKNTAAWKRNTKAKILQGQYEAELAAKMENDEQIKALRKQQKDALDRWRNSTDEGTRIGAEAEYKEYAREIDDLIKLNSVHNESMKDIEISLGALSDEMLGTIETSEAFMKALKNNEDNAEALAIALTELGFGTSNLKDITENDMKSIVGAFNDFTKAGYEVEDVRMYLDMLGFSEEELNSITASQWAEILRTYDGTSDSIIKSTQKIREELVKTGNTKTTINVDMTQLEAAIQKYGTLTKYAGMTIATTAVVDIVKRVTEEPHGATGTFTDFPIARAIPAHAAGGITGIVTQPTMTNWGLVGEAGAEALVRWAHGTAVVPLENHRYVRPFAQTIAREMGNVGNLGTTNVTNVYLNDVAVNNNPAIMAATEEYLGVLARYSAMGGR